MRLRSMRLLRLLDTTGQVGFARRMPNAHLKRTLIAAVRGGGAILQRYFGRVRHVRQKGEQASVVCEADLEAEAHVRRVVLDSFPTASIIGEEEGAQSGNSSLTWVVDPLDGTSNFVAGLPWFGCQAGILENHQPIMTAMYLPLQDTLYFAEKGQGTRKNGKLLPPLEARPLKEVLCAFGFDAAASEAARARSCKLLTRVAGAVRNTRATNSLVDFCYTLEGNFGACVNLNCKIWDIVPAALMFAELGGAFTDLAGKPIDFAKGEARPDHTYQILGAGKGIHKALLKITAPVMKA